MLINLELTNITKEPVSDNKKYKDFTNLAIRNFIKFIKGFKNDYRISKQSLFNLKHRPLIKRQVLKTDEN